MPFSVYVIKSVTTGKLYTGQTQQLDKRLLQHNDGSSPYTKNRGPWVLIYEENFATRAEAMAREKFLKTGKGREFLKSKIGQSN
ncbi:MAG: GIY-YIG nuclease family protein [Cyclobacteriaceae bacterium]|jgi:putative endonuclease|nr:GIY-YIG nuclease family protein [Cytophagales bacterium]